jgi:hydrogenase maturation protease
MTAEPAVVIGIGHPYRNDDAAGLTVVDHLAAAGTGLTLVSSTGEPTDLIDAWTGRCTAVVVDALCHPDARPGYVRRIIVDTLVDTVSTVNEATSSHGIGLGDTLALAGAIGRLPDRLVVYAIEVEDVGFGDTLSPAVADATVRVAEAIRAEFAPDDVTAPTTNSSG